MRPVDADKMINFECIMSDGRKCVMLPVEHLSDIPTIETPLAMWRDAASDPPTKGGAYLVCIRAFSSNYYIDVARYTSDLYRVNDYEFCDKKGCPGWYKLDSEYGDYECDVDFWMEAPEFPEFKRKQDGGD